MERRFPKRCRRILCIPEDCVFFDTASVSLHPRVFSLELERQDCMFEEATLLSIYSTRG